MELMIVVVITGVLATIAIPTFTGYITKSRTSEATHFLGVIKLKQEAYRAEFGQYLVQNGQNDPAAIAAFVPGNATVMDGTLVDFPTNNADFNTLGARPDGPVRFGYSWAAGLPTDADGNVDVAPWNMATPYDHYFVAQAVADLDDDLDSGGAACTFEITSFTRGIWFTPAKGWE
jgi:type II secretory pathway pseudopilin PulG